MGLCSCLAVLCTVLVTVPLSGHSNVIAEKTSKTDVFETRWNTTYNETDSPLTGRDNDVSCKGFSSKRYISDGFCRTAKPITEVVCTGHCLAVRNLPFYQEIVRVWGPTHTFEYHCVDDVVQHKRVPMICDNGQQRKYKIRIVKSCMCKKHHVRRQPMTPGVGDESRRRHHRHLVDDDHRQHQVDELRHAALTSRTTAEILPLVENATAEMRALRRISPTRHDRQSRLNNSVVMDTEQQHQQLRQHQRHQQVHQSRRGSDVVAPSDDVPRRSSFVTRTSASKLDLNTAAVAAHHRRKPPTETKLETITTPEGSESRSVQSTSTNNTAVHQLDGEVLPHV